MFVFQQILFSFEIKHDYMKRVSQLSILISFAICVFIAIGCHRKTIVESESANIIETIKIDSSLFQVGPCEPSICISPINTDIVVAGSILDKFYFSQDGGKTWNISRLKSTHGVYGDPVIRMDSDNNIYYAHLANPTGRAYQDEEFLNKIVVQKSTDLGKTWNNGTYPECDSIKDHDKQWLYIPDGTNEVLMSWTEFDKYASKDTKDRSRILFSISDDGAETWSPAVAISDLEGDCIDGDLTTEGALPIKTADGSIYVSWSFDSKIYLDKSSDGGKTWGVDKVIATQPGGWTFDVPAIGRCNGMPIIDSDSSNGSHKGTMYINWADQRNGVEDTDIWLAKSTDNGESWSDPIRVNDDAPGKHQFFSWMDVDQSTGYIYIVFYDRRAYDDAQTDVYLAYSKDGGQTFTNQKISEKPFTPNTNVFFGDYNDISAVNGIIRPVWTVANGGALSVHTALIEIK